jgi:hypothetical protein
MYAWLLGICILLGALQAGLLDDGGSGIPPRGAQVADGGTGVPPTSVTALDGGSGIPPRR